MPTAAHRTFALSVGLIVAWSMSAGAAAAASTVDSNTALSSNGGGCYAPPISQTSPFDQLAAVNPEWAPVVNGASPLSSPILVHGSVVDSHISQLDFPAGHVRFDQNTDISLDPADAHFLATGNLSSAEGRGLLELEWETGSYPSWAWAGEGDRIVALGRWIFDCGHPDPTPGHKSGSAVPCLTADDPPAGVACVGAVFNYRSEMHPPQAVAVIRSGGGATIRDAGRAVPVTRADVFVSADGGGAGDACVVTHKSSLPAILGAPCFPLSAPLALVPPGAAPLNSTDFTFIVPLPAVRGGRQPVLRVLTRTTPALGTTPVPARLQVTPHLDGADPHYEVTVKMTEAVEGRMPTGFAATLLAGWQQAPASPMVHLRVTIDGIVVNNALKPVVPRVPTPAGWKMQTNVNNDWQEIGGLDLVAAGSAGLFIPTSGAYDLFMPRSTPLNIHADAASAGCVDTLFGHSLLEDLFRFGFTGNPSTLPGALQLGLTCLSATELDAGSIDVTYTAPGFGVSDTPIQVMSSTGAFQLRFRIERVEDGG